MMKKPMIENYIEIEERKVRFDEMKEKERKEIAKKLQEKMMGTIGYKRTT